jgi:hypothetical protein
MLVVVVEKEEEEVVVVSECTLVFASAAGVTIWSNEDKRQSNISRIKE